VTARDLFSRRFRAAAEAVDPASNRLPPSPDLLAAWLTLHAVRGQTRWMDAALEATVDAPTADRPAAWLEAACRGWVQRASRQFRSLADSLERQVPDEPASVPALLLLWRTTGLRRLLDRALALVPDEVAPGDFVGAEAAWRAFLATADDSLRDRAAAGFGDDVAAVPPLHWPTFAAVTGLDADAFGAHADRLDDLSPARQLLVSAALACPLLELRVEWFVARELREGPMAEAATYPWPALRLSFQQMPGGRDQLRIVPYLDGEEMPAIIDVGVVVAALEMVLESADRTALLEGSGRRRGRSLLRRR